MVFAGLFGDGILLGVVFSGQWSRRGMFWNGYESVCWYLKGVFLSGSLWYDTRAALYCGIAEQRTLRYITKVYHEWSTGLCRLLRWVLIFLSFRLEVKWIHVLAGLAAYIYLQIFDVDVLREMNRQQFVWHTLSKFCHLSTVKWCQFRALARVEFKYINLIFLSFSGPDAL